jgi:hypothetical protein
VGTKTQLEKGAPQGNYSLQVILHLKVTRVEFEGLQHIETIVFEEMEMLITLIRSTYIVFTIKLSHCTSPISTNMLI